MPKITALFIAASLTLTACASTTPTSATMPPTTRAMAGDYAKCLQMGFVADTKEMATCRLTVRGQRKATSNTILGAAGSVLSSAAMLFVGLM